MKNLKCRNDSEEEKYETYKNFESTKWKSTLPQKIECKLFNKTAPSLDDKIATHYETFFEKSQYYFIRWAFVNQQIKKRVVYSENTQECRC